MSRSARPHSLKPRHISVAMETKATLVPLPAVAAHLPVCVFCFQCRAHAFDKRCPGQLVFDKRCPGNFQWLNHVAFLVFFERFELASWIQNGIKKPNTFWAAGGTNLCELSRTTCRSRRSLWACRVGCRLPCAIGQQVVSARSACGRRVVGVWPARAREARASMGFNLDCIHWY